MLLSARRTKSSIAPNSGFTFTPINGAASLVTKLLYETNIITSFTRVIGSGGAYVFISTSVRSRLAHLLTYISIKGDKKWTPLINDD